jgi:hypothetical protein
MAISTSVLTSFTCSVAWKAGPLRTYANVDAGTAQFGLPPSPIEVAQHSTAGDSPVSAVFLPTGDNATMPNATNPLYSPLNYTAPIMVRGVLQNQYQIGSSISDSKSNPTGWILTDQLYLDLVASGAITVY